MERKEYMISDEWFFKYLDEIRFDINRKGMAYLLCDFIKWRDGEQVYLHEIEVLMYHPSMKSFQMIVVNKPQTP